MKLLTGAALSNAVLEKMTNARESVLIATANVKAMMVELGPGRFQPIADLFARLAARGVEVRLLHAELPSRPFRAAFDRHQSLTSGGMTLKLCPRTHFKAVLVDAAWLYVGSANLTGAGLGAKHQDSRNFELGFITEDFALIDSISGLFDTVWSGAACSTCRLHRQCPDPIGPGPARKRSSPKAGGIVLGRSRRFRR